jgi:hypothetical protein
MAAIAANRYPHRGILPQRHPAVSNRHKVTLSATDEAIAKFVPATPKCSPGERHYANGGPCNSATILPGLQLPFAR